MDYSNDGAIDHLVDLAHNDEECEREGDEDDRDEPDAPPRDPDDPSLPDDDSDPLAIPTWIHDPSGYVYEAVESNRLEGVTATLTQAPASDGPWTVWDAEWFGQTNPLVTDDAGRYGWDVPEGWWQVQYAKDGYEPAHSAALEVLPPHFDVNVGLVSLAAPGVEAVTATAGSGGGVTVTFDKHMRLSVRDLEQIRVATPDGTPLPGRLEAVAPEESPAGEPLTRVFRFVPDATLKAGDALVVTVDAMATSYADRPLLETVTREVVVAAGQEEPRPEPPPRPVPPGRPDPLPRPEPPPPVPPGRPDPLPRPEPPGRPETRPPTPPVPRR